MSFSANLSKTAVLSALAAGLILPASALAEYYVPPGNSAANQYTESLPSAGGEQGGRGGGTVAPARSLGARNAQRLAAQGPAGEAAAEVAAETAPPASLVAADDGSRQPAAGARGSSPQRGSRQQGHAQRQGADGGAGLHRDQPSGSSGIGEIVAQATGASDDGNLGLWLPLAILVTLAGSIAYRLWPRHEPTA